MKPPMYVRELTALENSKLKEALRSPHAFTLRRAQILLASAEGKRPSHIARQVGCAVQTVRNVLKAFDERGLECLHEQSSRPKTVEPLFDQPRLETLRHLLHQSPRTYGKATSLWTLPQVAQVCLETGLTEREVSSETIRMALKRLKVKWQRAKHWISSPDPDYLLKKSDGIAS
jgi:transposase